MVHTIIDHLHVLSCAVGKAASCEPFVAVIVAAAVERAKLPRSDPDSMAHAEEECRADTDAIMEFMFATVKLCKKRLNSFSE